jgi:hypothetical protein
VVGGCVEVDPAKLVGGLLGLGCPTAAKENQPAKSP